MQSGIQRGSGTADNGIIPRGETRELRLKIKLEMNYVHHGITRIHAVTVNEWSAMLNFDV